jgi:hypothetical protein
MVEKKKKPPETAQEKVTNTVGTFLKEDSTESLRKGTITILMSR